MKHHKQQLKLKKKKLNCVSLCSASWDWVDAKVLFLQFNLYENTQ